MRFGLVLIFIGAFISSCTTYTDEEKIVFNKEVEAYIEKNKLETQSTETGLHYIVEREGEGRYIKLTDIVHVKYKAYLLDGTVFDSTGTEIRSFKLKNTILGWREGFTFFKKGGKGKLIVPPQVGYGEKEQAKIPKNSILIYDFEVVDVK